MNKTISWLVSCIAVLILICGALWMQGSQIESESWRLMGENKMLTAQIDELRLQVDLARNALADAPPAGPLKLTPLGDYLCTAYCCERYPHICGGNGITASGTVPTPGVTAASDWGDIPAGSWIYIEGIGIRQVQDTGSAVKGKKLDIAVQTHAEAEVWAGYGNHQVYLIEEIYK